MPIALTQKLFFEKPLSLNCEIIHQKQQDPAGTAPLRPGVKPPPHRLKRPVAIYLFCIIHSGVPIEIDCAPLHQQK